MAKRRKPATPEIRAKVVAAYLRNGTSFTAVAERFGYSDVAVRRWVLAAGVPTKGLHVRHRRAAAATQPQVAATSAQRGDARKAHDAIVATIERLERTVEAQRAEIDRLRAAASSSWWNIFKRKGA